MSKKVNNKMINDIVNKSRHIYTERYIYTDT